MKTPLIIAAAAILAVGCDQQRQAKTERPLDTEKSAVRKTVREAKAEVDEQAKAQKDVLDAEAKAAQAKIDAEKARAKAESTDVQAKVDAASRRIRDAAGAAGTKIQTEVGGAKNPPPAESSTVPATQPTPSPASTAAGSDEKLAEQVRTAVLGGATANTDESKAIQVQATGGTVTLKGSVKSEAEKRQIESAATAVSGVTKVDNQLVIKTE